MLYILAPFSWIFCFSDAGIDAVEILVEDGLLTCLWVPNGVIGVLSIRKYAGFREDEGVGAWLVMGG